MSELVRGQTKDLGMVDEEQPQPTKIEMKRQQIYMDRIKRHMSRGMSQQDAQAAIAREDYERLPVAERLEAARAMFVGGHQQLAKEIQDLRYNDGVIADAMDLNFMAIGVMLSELGISAEKQKEVAIRCKEIMAEQRKAATEKVQQAQEAKKEEAVKDAIEAPGEPAAPPPEATEFGG